MTTVLLAIAAGLAPVAAVVALLRLTDRLQQRRDARHARQIELTDAIHRELGAAAAPTVEGRRGGGWLVRMAVPLDNPTMVATILRLTDEAFASSDMQIVLTPRVASLPAMAGQRRSARQDQVRPAASIVAAAR